MNTKALLNEITETGFYCVIDDKEKEIIFEVINNTDDVWLKESPEDKYLIDEWLYNYTDYDDRKVYGTSGNLISVRTASPCEVYKLKSKYKMYGQSGQYLIEDKPTYKEQFQTEKQLCVRQSQELIRLKKELQENKQKNSNLLQECEQLKDELSAIQHNCNREGCKYYNGNTFKVFYECKAQKALQLSANSVTTKYCDLLKTLAEIEEITEPYRMTIKKICGNCKKYDDCNACCYKDINRYKYTSANTNACEEFTYLDELIPNILANNILQKLSECEVQK